MTSGFSEPGDWWLANQRDPDLCEWHSDRADSAITRLSAALFNGQNRPIIDSYDNWRAPIKGDQVRSARRYIPEARVCISGAVAAVFGNSTKYNPKVRNFWNQDESISLAKSFRITEDMRHRLRGEAFNILNRTIFGSGVPI